MENPVPMSASDKLQGLFGIALFVGLYGGAAVIFVAAVLWAVGFLFSH